MTTVEELLAVKELLKNEDNWCKGSFAKNKNGQAISYNSPDAVKFCVVGAIRRTCKNNYGSLSFRAIKKALNGVNISLWNDSRETTHEDIMNLLDKAIDNARNA